ISDKGIGTDLSIKNILFGKVIIRSEYLACLELYLSRKIVEAHGGIIWLDNTDGKGSTLHSTYY
ncbi:MAG: PAS domain-containing sensor histidine kinase, partial [Nitrososphaeraceae archaeon]